MKKEESFLRMSRRVFAVIVFLAGYVRVVYASRDFGVVSKAVSLITWLLVALHFIVPVLERVFLYTGKYERDSQPMRSKGIDILMAEGK